MEIGSQVDQLEEAVVVSCHLLALGTTVRAIQVLTDLRPGYPELMHLRDLADEHGLAFVVLGSGGFMLRSSCPSPAGVTREDAMAWR